MNIQKQDKPLLITFLKNHCIKNLRCKDKAVHNLVLLLITEVDKKSNYKELMRYLKK